MKTSAPLAALLRPLPIYIETTPYNLFVVETFIKLQDHFPL